MTERAAAWNSAGRVVGHVCAVAVGVGDGGQVQVGVIAVVGGAAVRVGLGQQHVVVIHVRHAKIVRVRGAVRRARVVPWQRDVATAGLLDIHSSLAVYEPPYGIEP